MDRGKATCKILKEIRKQIAKENDIAFITSECQYQGNCQGTCPACEAEVRFLEEELRKRKQLGKTALVTGVSLGLATSFLGCHFGGNAEDNATDSVSSSSAKQEGELSSAPISEENLIEPASTKAMRSTTPLLMTTKEVAVKSSDYDFARAGDKSIQTGRQTISSDTIEIIYEVPQFTEGDMVVMSNECLSQGFENAHIQLSIEPVFPGSNEECRQYLQQHFRISSNLKQYLRGKKISFNFTIEENGKIGQVDVHCNYDYKSQKSWAKRCERAAKKALKSMPRWTPGKNEFGRPVRSYSSGVITIGSTPEVLIFR